MAISEMLGVECPVCHKECFQLSEREAKLSPETSVIVKCCPACRRKVDYENEKSESSVRTSGMTKLERRLYNQGVSREWASQFHSRRVIVYYAVSNGYGGWLRLNQQVSGMAYHLPRYKWGHLRVVIDESEYKRILFRDSYYYKGFKQVNYRQPVMDGYEWNEIFITDGWYGKDDKPYCFYIQWGDIRSGNIQVEFNTIDK